MNKKGQDTLKIARDVIGAGIVIFILWLIYLALKQTTLGSHIP